MSKSKTCGECRYRYAYHHDEDCDGRCELFKTYRIPSNKRACSKFKSIPPPTNGDKIRQMNTSDLIDVIVCPYPNKVCIHRIMDGYACKCCKRDWLNAPAGKDNNVPAKEGEVHNGFEKCAYCGKPYRKNKKAQRFCSIKCKDKWWNRERAEDREYLHPQCEDNFNGEC